MAITTSGAMGVSSFPSSSSCFSRNCRATASTTTTTFYSSTLYIIGSKTAKSGTRISITCSAVQESSASAEVAAETKEVKKVEEKAPPKMAKPPAKAPVKELPQMMEEDVIPSLRAILEAEQDIIDLDFSFKDNRLEGSFKKKGNPYSFWAFFPDGVLTGPKGFSLSSYGSGASTVEPFLVDEKKITAKLIIFWVEKRLAAQGIIPVWKD